jgi:transcriptional regulator with XRE-family HTH domain
MSGQSTEVGFAIRKAREDRGYSRRELAELSGVSAQSIVDWELRGKSPCLDTLILVADVLDISLDELVGRDRKKEKKYEAELIQVTEHYGYTYENYNGYMQYVVWEIKDGKKDHAVTGRLKNRDARNACIYVEKLNFNKEY